MSAGAFLRSRYESNSGGIYNIRVQPETLEFTANSVANDPPAGAVDQEISARASGSKRTLGMNARTVTFVFSGTPPGTYKADSPITIPVLTATAWDSYLRGSTGTYLSTAIVVVGKSAESAV